MQDKIEDVFNVTKSSPKDGTIKISMNPKEKINVGDAIQMQVTLVNTGGFDFDEIFWVKISVLINFVI